jgi:hypothetical protein
VPSDSIIFSLQLNRQALARTPKGARPVGVLFADPRRNYLQVLLDENMTEDEIREVVMQLAGLLKAAKPIVVDSAFQTH